MLSIELNGGAKIIESFKRLGTRIPEAMSIAVKKAMLVPERFIKQEELSGQLVNVRTGNLRASVNSRPLTVDGKIVYGRVKAGGFGKDKEVYYAKYLEDGTSKIRARHFMKLGLEKSVDKIKEVFRQTIAELAQKWGI